MAIIVRNAVGTRKDHDNIGNLNRWKEYTTSPIRCSMITCFKTKKLEGAHVEYEDEGFKYQYIIPLCDKHHGKHGEEVVIKDGVFRLSVELLET